MTCAHVMCHVWCDVCTMNWLSDVCTRTRQVKWLVHTSCVMCGMTCAQWRDCLTCTQWLMWRDLSMTHLRKVFCDMTRQWRMWRDLSMTHSALWCDSSMSLKTPSAESVLWHDSSMTLPTWLFDNSWCAVIWLINVSRNTIYRKCSLTWLTGRDLSMTHQCL